MLFGIMSGLCIMGTKSILNMSTIMVAALVACSDASAAVMRLQVRVVDADTGEPIAGAEVGAGFSNPPAMWGGESHDVERDGVTDKNGVCSFLGRSSRGECDFTARKTGEYYSGDGEWKLSVKDHDLPLVPHFHSMTVALHRVKSPIPLFVNEVSVVKTMGIFGDENVVRYDLMKGDWMPPKGAGELADVEFVRHATEELGLGTNGAGIVDMRLRDHVTVRFLGEDCGIVAVNPFLDSYLKWRTAPECGYEREHICERTTPEDLQVKVNWDGDQCHCFRIRVKKDSNGEIVEAYYGKIYGGIKFNLEKKDSSWQISGIGFLYYLNPTSLNKNLEYDQKHNLNTGTRCRFAP